MKRISLIIIALAPLLWIGCREEERIDQIDSNAPAPAQVTITNNYGTPGGAVLKYAVPTGENLLYVRAEYETQPGVVRECRSSFYKDSLVLEGFGDERVYDVKVYSVGRNEKTSEPLAVRVIPEKAPVHLATKEFKETFGGVSVIVNNPERANLAIVLMGDIDHTGHQAYLETYFTSKSKASFTFRGSSGKLGIEPYDFSVYLRDRWGNLSSVEKGTVEPLFEELIPKDTWDYFDLPGDAPSTSSFTPSNLSSIWRDPSTTSNFEWASYNQSGIYPFWGTWDMGLTAIIGRIKVWHNTTAPAEIAFTRTSPRIFELWGSANPNLDGSWASWIPLGRFEIEKPSPGEAVTEEDMEAARAGFDFDLGRDEFSPDPFVPIRYIRLKTVEPFGGYRYSGAVLYRQITFWGTVVE